GQRSPDPFESPDPRGRSRLRLYRLFRFRAGVPPHPSQDTRPASPLVRHIRLIKRHTIGAAACRMLLRETTRSIMQIIASETAELEQTDLTAQVRHPAVRDASNGMWFSDTEPPAVDARKLCDGRLAKLRAWMREAGYGAVLLFDPYNQRYATGTRNMFGYF